MDTSTWIFISFNVINIILTICFILKIAMKLEKRISQIEKYVMEDSIKNQVDVEKSVATGLVRGLQQMKDDEEKHLKLLEMGRQLQRTPLKVMNQNSVPKNFDTGGDLIPGNLTKEEEEILKMYYDRSNER